MERKTEIVQIQDPDATNPFSLLIEPGNGKPARQLVFNTPEILESNAIKEELKSFARSIRENSKPAVTIEDGFNAMQVAHQILDQLNYTNSIFAA